MGLSLATAGPPRKKPLMCLSSTSLSVGCRGKNVFGSSQAHYSAQVSDRCDSGQNKKHMPFQKESKNIFLPTISIMPLCSQSAQPFHPLATRAEAWQAIPGASAWAHHHSAQRGRPSPFCLSSNLPGSLTLFKPLFCLLCP